MDAHNPPVDAREAEKRRVSHAGRSRTLALDRISREIAGRDWNPIDVFVQLISDGGRAVVKNSVPLIALAQAGKPGYFDGAGFPAGHGRDEIALPPSPTSTPMRWRFPVIRWSRSIATIRC